MTNFPVVTSYPVPGRGAWRLAGGLLPAYPGNRSGVGFYRQSIGREVPIGSSWLSTDTSHDAQCVWLGVQVIQHLVGADPDGWFGKNTAAAVVAAQTGWGIEADGIVGRVTMRAALSPLITQIAAAHQVPVAILGGLATLESSLDPAAVGVNGQDHGLVQINLGAHTVSLADAMDASFALVWAALDLAHTHEVWASRTTADPWDVAIAHHNSPALANRWAVTGAAPVVEGRIIQIGDYVAKVRSTW